MTSMTTPGTPGDPHDDKTSRPAEHPVGPNAATSSDAFDLDAFMSHARRRRAEDTTLHAGRPSDWVEPDALAITALGPYRHPVHRAAQRHRAGRSRTDFMNNVRRACARLQDKETHEVSLEAALAYPWHHLDVVALVDYRARIYAMTSVQSTRNDAMSVVRRVILQCHATRLISAHRRDDLLEELWTRAPGPSARRRRLDPLEVAALLAACEEMGSARARARNTAMVALLRGTGIRVGELVTADYDDWDEHDQTLLLRATKNNQDHTVFLSRAVTAYLERWVAVRGTGSGALFTALNDNRRTREPLGTVSVRYMLKTRAVRAGITRPFGPHDFRRTFATELLRTHDAALVGKLLNHNKLASTLIYDLAEDDLQREAVRSIDLRLPDLPPIPEDGSDVTYPDGDEVA